MANKHVKRSSTSLVTKANQNRHEKPLHVPWIGCHNKTTDGGECWSGCGDTGAPHTADGNENGAATLEKGLAVSQKVQCNFTI